jgi:uncharacterized membrane protein YraQ (UPF0718 family)
MLAAPIVNPITALSTWNAFQGQGGGRMVAARLILGYLVSVAVGLIVLRLRLRSVIKPDLLLDLPAGKEKPCGNCCGGDRQHHHHHHHHEPHPANPDRPIAAPRSAMDDFVDVAVYFTIGVAITALFNTGIAPGAEWLDSVEGNPICAPAVPAAADDEDFP